MKVNYYTKYGCCLCDEGLALLRKFTNIDIRIIDVENDVDKYGSYLNRIPVISADNGKKELAWPFDEEDIRKLLSQSEP
mgnify:FL=1